MALKVGEEKVEFGKTFVYQGYGKWLEKNTSSATVEAQEALLAELQQKTEPANSQLVNANSLPLPTGAATAAQQLPDNHNVTVSNQISTTGLATSAKQDSLLTELQLKADKTETQPVSMATLPTDAATATNQQLMAELIETLNELNARLMVLAGMANSGQPALRTIPIASVSTAVTGSVTATVASTSITNFGTGYPATEVSHDINNYTAIVANINNVVVSP